MNLIESLKLFLPKVAFGIDAIQSGYKISAVDVLTTELNTLTNNSWSALSSGIDNESGKYLSADIEVDLASITPTGTDAAIEIYLVPSIDGGTSYPNYTETGSSDEQENQIYFVGSVPMSLDAEVQNPILRNVDLPPGFFKIGIRNRANVSLAASGNVVRYRPHNLASA